MKIELELSEQELDDLLTALCEWTPDNQYRGNESDPDDIRNDANDYCSNREVRMGALYQRFGQFLPADEVTPGVTKADMEWVDRMNTKPEVHVPAQRLDELAKILKGRDK